jgi:hypothetical protein
MTKFDGCAIGPPISTIRVNLRHSIDPYNQCVVLMPTGLSSADLDEFEEVLKIQLRAVRRSIAPQANVQTYLRRVNKRRAK